MLFFLLLSQSLLLLIVFLCTDRRSGRVLTIPQKERIKKAALLLFLGLSATHFLISVTTGVVMLIFAMAYLCLITFYPNRYGVVSVLFVGSILISYAG